jgi:hypothetical protein
MKMSELMRENVSMVQLSTPMMMRQIRSGLDQVFAEDLPEEFKALAAECQKKYAVFAAMGAMQPYVDMMNGYIALLEYMEKSIGKN